MQQQKDSYQGIWIVSPDGKALAREHDFDRRGLSGAEINKKLDRATLDMLDEGLKAFGPVQPRQVKLAAQVVARHERCYVPGSQVLDPLHYLASLQRRPAALDHANVYRHWHLPAIFQDMRERLEARHGPLAGRRHFVRVLELLAEHPQPRVQQALEHSQGSEGLDAEVIAQRTRQLALQEQLAQPPATLSAHAERGRRPAASPRRGNPS